MHILGGAVPANPFGTVYPERSRMGSGRTGFGWGVMKNKVCVLRKESQGQSTPPLNYAISAFVVARNAAKWSLLTGVLANGVRASTIQL